MRNRFAKLMLIRKVPSPRRVFRLPETPGRVNSKDWRPLAGSGKMFGPPAPTMAGAFFVVFWTGTEICVAYGAGPQLVGHTDPSFTAATSPLVWNQLPLNCQPPRSALTAPGLLLRNLLPFPNGISQIANAFTECVTS